MADARKILSHDLLIAKRTQARASGKTLVHCHGCFDIVHPGHIRHLRYAKGLGDLLLVTITGDDEMKKGTGRPLIPEELRAENLAELDCVDWVYIEPRPTAAELLAEVQPDVYLKGKEYETNDDPRFKAERNAVERAGGRVVFSSGDVVFSSTALIAAMERSVDPFHKRLVQLTQRPELSTSALAERIASFRSRRLVVCGETILDTYIACDQPDIAGESPVMTLRPIQKHHYEGGAAIIARHAAAMGARPILITALPPTPAAEQIRQRLVAEGVEVRSIAAGSSLPEKQRFLVGAQKVMKLDLVEPYALDAGQHEQLLNLASEAAVDADAAIIADFGLGLFTPALLRRLCRELRKRVRVLSGDVSGRRSNLRAMHSMDLLCPSEREIRDCFHLYDEGLPAVVARLLEETRAASAIITLGADGLLVFDRPDTAPGKGWDKRLNSEHIPSLASFAIDPLGCGDSLLTTATLALASGASRLAAAFLGSVAAASQAQRLGNIPVSASELRQGVARVHSAHLAYAAAEVIPPRALRAPLPAAKAS